ncbi:hypothetical protein FRC04_004443 [Tulasnella sp. 424]|nr:hypothetical protein FRC04_004443 [Tulasnella sp. 424]KAG8967451.1 hypothetical protein FRC05_002046 [Tulasnella sp. 425]
MPAQPLESTPFFTLNNGQKIPAVGLGCWMGSPGQGERCEEMVRKGLKLGYRHLDTAAGYANEEHTGKAIRESGIPRSEIFLTTKLGDRDHGRVKEALEESLSKLDCEYIDLYLMHWPQAQDSNGKTLQPEESPTYVETWKEMEKLLDTGKVKSIGVSNFSIKTLEVLLPEAKIVQMHPSLPQRDLVDYCATKGIHITAYSPLGQVNSPFYTDETVTRVAEKSGITAAQVLLSWAVQRGTSVIPKSEKEERLKNNITIVRLDDEDFEAIENLHKRPGMNRQLIFPSNNFIDGKRAQFGWTYEQLGWEYE